MFARGFLRTIPTHLVGTISRLARPLDWSSVYVACSGTFRIERGLFAEHGGTGIQLHSNDVSLFTTALGRAALGDPLDFRFTGPLAFIEDIVGASEPFTRAAAVIVALNYAAYVKGKAKRFKEAHLHHMQARFGEYVADARGQLERVIPALKIESFTGCDFRDHIEQAIQERAGVITYPPTFAGGYEKQFEFLNEHTDWERPSYRVFDPDSDLAPVLERLNSSGIPFFLCCDQEVPGFTPQARVEAKGARPILGYTHTERTSYRAPSNASKRFAYQTVDLAQLHRKSKLTVVPVPEAYITFLREAYLKKGISFRTGDFGVLVFIDDMLAGAISYRKLQGNPKAVYVLTDLSVTREGRIAKLVARLATHRAVLAPLERRTIQRFTSIRTAAFSEHPEAMKYRGAWEVESREELTDGAARYKITYVAKPREEPIQDCYRWWFSRGGESEVAAARKRDQDRRSQEAPAA